MSTAVREQGAPSRPHPSPSLWHLAAVSFLPADQRGAALSWVRHLPLVVVLGAQMLLTLRLTNSIFSDEALHISVGQDYLALWRDGTPVPEPGPAVSGRPRTYPVLAGALAAAGGLELVRALSLVSMLGATVAVHAAGRHIGGTRAGLLSSVTFVLTGPVLFVGRLGTFDAPVIALLAVALALALTRSGYGSATLAGLALAGAAVTAPNAAVFIPSILVIILVASPEPRRTAGRAATAAGVTACVTAAVFTFGTRWVGEDIVPGPAARDARSPRPIATLWGDLGLSIGLLAVLALIGAGALLATQHGTGQRRRSTITVLALVGAAAVVPAWHLAVQEYVSFNRHLAYSSLFLAPLAGSVVVAVRGRLGRIVALVIALWLMLLLALARSAFLMSEWPDTTRVVDVVRADPHPGTYLSEYGWSMAFHGDDIPGVEFQEPWELFEEGPEAITEAILSSRYRGIIYRNESTSGEGHDPDVALIAALVADLPDYTLVAAVPVGQFETDVWYIWVRLGGSD